MKQMEMEAGTEAQLAIERAAARQHAQAAHEHHRQGTVAACILCEDVAYEPGWYALLASFARNSQDPTITLPNAAVVQI
ncbi:MAG: hypothetical protein QOI81_324 [Actinomycetota bacterium]|jgi:hypothetical protein|nr:hypothetical protein [Actinomycetota bacterium]